LISTDCSNSNELNEIFFTQNCHYRNLSGKQQLKFYILGLKLEWKSSICTCTHVQTFKCSTVFFLEYLIFSGGKIKGKLHVFRLRLMLRCAVCQKASCNISKLVNKRTRQGSRSVIFEELKFSKMVSPNGPLPQILRPQRPFSINSHAAFPKKSKNANTLSVAKHWPWPGRPNA
jgi:hypothetical protein